MDIKYHTKILSWEEAEKRYPQCSPLWDINVKTYPGLADKEFILVEISGFPKELFAFCIDCIDDGKLTHSLALFDRLTCHCHTYFNSLFKWISLNRQSFTK